MAGGDLKERLGAGSVPPSWPKYYGVCSAIEGNACPEVDAWKGGTRKNEVDVGLERVYGVAHLWGDVEITRVACWVVVVDTKLVSQKKGRTCTRGTLGHV